MKRERKVSELERMRMVVTSAQAIRSIGAHRGRRLDLWMGAIQPLVVLKGLQGASRDQNWSAAVTINDHVVMACKRKRSPAES